MKPPLYAHQARARDEAVHALSMGGHFAFFHEVGLGKSRTLIETATALRSMDRIDVLVICGPKSLAGTWKEQVGLHCDVAGAGLCVFDAQKSKTKKWLQGFVEVLSAPFPIFFVNTEAFQVMPDTLKSVLSSITKRGRVLLAIDESSDIKGPKANRTKNITKFGQSCAARVIMTGTEITNSVLDLYSQFEFLKPGFWGFKSFFFFKNYYAILEDRYLSGGRTFKEIVGFRKIQEIQDRIAPVTSRARKVDCLDLPEKIHANLPVTMSGPCEKAYSELKGQLMTLLDSGELVTVVNKVALFTKFRQITGGTLAGVGVIDPKNAKLTALLDELADSGEQAIIWSCFTEEINLLEATLKKLYPVVRFDGQTNNSDREEAIIKFRDGRARLFIANPAAASQGLNLQNAHIEYWYSMPTQAKQYEQAEGRIHRSGQRETCVYKRILCEGTVDARVARILDEKTDVMAAFRDGTVADIINLV